VDGERRVPVILNCLQRFAPCPIKQRCGGLDPRSVCRMEGELA